MNKLQRLRQGSMSVEQYRQQMKLLLLRDGLREEERKSIARFLSGLNIEVREVPEICSAYSPYGQTRGLFCAAGRAPARASEEKWLPNPERHSNSPPSSGFAMIHRTKR